MAWTDELIDRLTKQIPCGYHPSGAAASEPTALAAIALTAAGRRSGAEAALDWLAGAQIADGSIRCTSDPTSPGWTTGWAVLAALTEQRIRPVADAPHGRIFDIARAVAWMLHISGESLPRTSEIGHDSTLIGWPWVAGSHSWIEPTAISVLALKRAGQADHPRTREAVRMLIDRLLPGGGCNYGNTFVFGQELRPHVQSTGLAMLALAGEPDLDGRIGRSLDYLTKNLTADSTAASLSYGLLGLAARGRFPAAGLEWLSAAYRRTIARDAAPYQLALISLAALGERSPLVGARETDLGATSGRPDLFAVSPA